MTVHKSYKLTEEQQKEVDQALAEGAKKYAPIKDIIWEFYPPEELGLVDRFLLFIGLKERCKCCHAVIWSDGKWFCNDKCAYDWFHGN